MKGQCDTRAAPNTDWVKELDLAEFQLEKLKRLRDRKQRELDRLDKDIRELTEFLEGG